MITTIILAVLVSLGVWIITSDYFFYPDQTLVTAAVALAVGLLIVFIFRALMKPAASPKPVFVQLFVVALATLVSLFGLSKVARDRDCPGPISLQVSCENPPSIQYACADPGTRVTWLVPAGFTVRIHTFIRKRPWPWPDKPESPLERDPGASNGPPIEAMVKGYPNKGEYKYSVTCASDGQENTTDPIFDVPKGGGGRY